MKTKTLYESEINKKSENICDFLKCIQIEMKVRGLSKQTSKMYLFYNRKFLEFIKKPPKNIIDTDIKDFLAYKLSEGPVSNRSINLIKAALKFYYGDKLNFSSIKTPRPIKKLPTILSKTEIKQLLKKTENIKHRLLIELLYSTGLRLSECINLRHSDLELSSDTGWVRNGKGEKDRMFIISDTFKKHLLYYMKKKGYNEEGYIFMVNGRKMSPRGVQHAIKISAERAGIRKKVHVHTLRHSFAAHLLESGIDIIKIQRLLGYSGLQMMEIYTQLSSQEDKEYK